MRRRGFSADRRRRSGKPGRRCHENPFAVDADQATHGADEARVVLDVVERPFGQAVGVIRPGLGQRSSQLTADGRRQEQWRDRGRGACRGRSAGPGQESPARRSPVPSVGKST
jgi:hypothetical protein